MVDDLALLRAMLRIRRLEEQVIHLADERDGLIRAHQHVSVGPEAAGVGACAALRRDDLVFTTHRNHRHLLAKGAHPGRVLAEILGRSGGYSQGRAGTFHVAAPELGVLHTSAIVGGCLPLAAGAAYGTMLQRSDRVTLVFFGPVKRVSVLPVPVAYAEPLERYITPRIDRIVAAVRVVCA